MTNAMNKAVAFAESKVGLGYIYGATGWVCSLARRQAQAAQYPEQYNNIMVVGKKWDGVQCYDCAQLTRWAVDASGGYLPSGANSQWKGNYWLEKGDIGDLPYNTPCFLYRRNANGVAQHTGLYITSGMVIEARGTREGVIRSRLESYPWTDYAVHTIAGMSSAEHSEMMPPYACAVRTKTGNGISLWASSAKTSKVAAIPEGAQVIVIGNVAPDGFAPSEYDGKAGVADSQYLLPMLEQDGGSPEPEPEPSPSAYTVLTDGYGSDPLTKEQAFNLAGELRAAGYVSVPREVTV